MAEMRCMILLAYATHCFLPIGLAKSLIIEALLNELYLESLNLLILVEFRPRVFEIVEKNKRHA